MDKTKTNVVALVNDHPILQSDLDLALKALSMNKDNSITPKQVKLVLDRLIDEQLLLQRGIELNLPQNSSPVRKTRGQDIMAACGQLKSDSVKIRKSISRL